MRGRGALARTCCAQHAAAAFWLLFPRAALEWASRVLQGRMIALQPELKHLYMHDGLFLEGHTSTVASSVS